MNAGSRARAAVGVDPLAFCAEEVARLEASGLGRRVRALGSASEPEVLLDGRRVLCLASNNYLGLAAHPEVVEAAAGAARRYGAGSGSARLVTGGLTLHDELEARLAAFKGTEAALLFSSGYLANLGTVAALVGPGDAVFSDELNHASIVDGCRLSRAQVVVYRHGDVEHLLWSMRRSSGRGSAQGNRLIVTDSVFSMDGDVAPLEGLMDLARRHDCRLMVDEAHATGTIGPGGRGSVAAADLTGEVDILVGTLGKALGDYGAYVCGREEIVDFLVNSARPFIFSTASPPPVVAAALAALELLESHPHRVERLADNAAVLRNSLAGEGFGVDPDGTHIVPVIVGDAKLTMELCERVLERGVFAQGIRPPTVPDGSSRLRLAVMATHREAELRHAAKLIAACGRDLGLQLEPPPEARADAWDAWPEAA